MMVTSFKFLNSSPKVCGCLDTLDEVRGISMTCCCSAAAIPLNLKVRPLCLSVHAQHVDGSVHVRKPVHAWRRARGIETSFNIRSLQHGVGIYISHIWPLRYPDSQHSPSVSCATPPGSKSHKVYNSCILYAPR